MCIVREISVFSTSTTRKFAYVVPKVLRLPGHRVFARRDSEGHFGVGKKFDSFDRPFQSQLPVLICITMFLNVDLRQLVRAILHFFPKLRHIHVQIHCNANEKS